MNILRLSLFCFVLLSIVSLSACEDKDTIILDTSQKNQMTVTGQQQYKRHRILLLPRSAFRL